MTKVRAISMGLVLSIVFTFSACVLGASAASPSSAPTAKTVTSTATTSSLTGGSIITPDFDYGPDGGPTLEEILAEGGVVQEGDVGRAVKEVQSDLDYVFWWATGNITVDGYFGSQTYEGVIYFQTWWNRNYPNNQLSIDGIVGPATYQAMTHMLSGE